MESSSSRRMVTRAWELGMASDEDSRALLQSRLIVLSRLMFWSFVALLGAMFALYQQYPKKTPEHQETIYIIAAVGIAALVVLWRGFLLRRTLSINALHAIDTFYG